MICGSFSESVNRRLELVDVDPNLFCRLLDIWCGKDRADQESVWESIELAALADRFEIAEVGAALEDKILSHLDVNTCAEIFSRSSSLGLMRVEEAARIHVTECFEEIARGKGFMAFDEDAFSRILDEDGLRVSKEEDVFEAVVAWMQGGAEGLRGRSLLHKVRFGLITERFLSTRARDMFGPEHKACIEPYIHEALNLKSHGLGRIHFDFLGPKALIRRSGPGVKWAAYSEEGRVPAFVETGGSVLSVAECGGRVFIALENGTISVLDARSMHVERTLQVELKPGEEYIFAVSDCCGQLLSGHWNGAIVAWDVESGDRVCVLHGHSGSRVSAFAASGSRLVSGSLDGTIRAWCMGGTSWPCDWAAPGHDGMAVGALAIWDDKAISGSEDETVRVWNLGTGAPEAVLQGHRAGVRALLVSGGRLFSASRDGTIREWAVGTWTGLRTVAVGDEAGGQWPSCLAVSGAWLLSGTACSRLATDARCRMQAWDLATLACEHSLPQADDGLCFQCLAAAPGEVWCVVGGAVMVWGRE